MLENTVAALVAVPTDRVTYGRAPSNIPTVLFQSLLCLSALQQRGNRVFEHANSLF